MDEIRVAERLTQLETRMTHLEGQRLALDERFEEAKEAWDDKFEQLGSTLSSIRNSVAAIKYTMIGTMVGIMAMVGIILSRPDLIARAVQAFTGH